MLTMLRVAKRLPFYNMDELNMLLRKLEKDEYVTCKHCDLYTITLDGYLFQGYEKQAKYDKIINQNRRIRTFVLAWGTVLAGIAALALLIWQVYSFYHPVPNPCQITYSK